MRRASTHTLAFKLPVDPSYYSEILITTSQPITGVEINKRKNELLVSGNTVSVTLTQEETNLFSDDFDAYVQIRCYASPYEAPASRIWGINVEPSLNDEVLG